jgi:hypothetical protein
MNTNGNLPPQPWTLERAEAFVMPFGKYRGFTIGAIGRTNRGYLEWVASTLDRGMQKAARIYLAHLRATDQAPKGGAK